MNYEIVIPNADGTLKRDATPYVNHNGIIKTVMRVMQRPLEGGDVRCVWERGDKYLYLKTDSSTALRNAYLTEDENAEVKLTGKQIYIYFVIPQTLEFENRTYKIKSLKFTGGGVGDEHGVFVYFYGKDANGQTGTRASYFDNWTNTTATEIFYCYDPAVPQYSDEKYSRISTYYNDQGAPRDYTFKCRFTYSPVF